MVEKGKAKGGIKKNKERETKKSKKVKTTCLVCSLLRCGGLLLSAAAETGGWTSCMLGRQQRVHCGPCDLARERRRGVGLGTSS